MFFITTIGQPSSSPESIRKILKNSYVSYLRFNLGVQLGFDVHHQRIEMARDCINELGLEKRVKIMVDLPYPMAKIRIGMLPLTEHPIKSGEMVTFKTAHESNNFNDYVPVEYDEIGHLVSIGEKISIGDGELGLEIVNIFNDSEFQARCLYDGTIPCAKSLNIGTLIDKINTHDSAKLLRNVQKLQPDCITLSFIQNPLQLARALNELKKYDLNQSKNEIAIKIETEEGVNSIEEFSSNVRMLILGRGDLGVNSPIV